MKSKVFVNGTFDLLHPGHLYLLNFAKSYGDYLIVGIDTDDRVREKKGPTAPRARRTLAWPPRRKNASRHQLLLVACCDFESL